MTNPEVSLEQARVAEAMRTGVLTCPPSASLRTVARMMSQYSIHAVVVTEVDDEGDEERAWRMVSDLALARHAADADETTAGGAASEPLVTLSAEDSLQRAAEMMAEHRTSHVVVTEQTSGRPVGIVSTLDLARAIAATRA
jgi:signal-transduction protein with cAMP-binding, CBS, and nucleotidyltransferase domain